MSKEFLQQSLRVAGLASGIGNHCLNVMRGRKEKKLDLRAEILGLDRALKGVPRSNSPDHRLVLDALRKVRDIAERIAVCDPMYAHEIGTELCQAGLSLREAVMKTPAEERTLSWLDQTDAENRRGNATSSQPGQQVGKSLDSLILAIDELLAFAQNHAGDPLNPSTLLTEEQITELRGLDVTLYAQCCINGLHIPSFREPPHDLYQPFGNSKLPCTNVVIHIGAQASAGMQIHPTSEWKHALQSLGTTAKALKLKGKSGTFGGIQFVPATSVLPEDMWPRLSPESAAQVQSKEPIHLSLGTLISMLASDGNLVPATLARCRELPAIRNYATQLGLCRPGEFTHYTAMAIRDMLCVERAIDQRTAAAEMLPAVLLFLKDKVMGPGKAGAPGADDVQADAPQAKDQREEKNASPSRLERPGPRLIIDTETNTITLDGKPFRNVDPQATRALKLYQEANSCYLSSKSICQSIRGCANEKTLRKILGRLPTKLRGLLRSKPGSGRCLQLPALQDAKAKKGRNNP